MRTLACMVAVLMLQACGGGTAARPPAAEAGGEAAARPERRTEVQATAAQQKQWGVSVAQPEQTTETGVVSLSGVLRLDEQHTAQITSLLDGRVVSLGAGLGDDVRQGQVLATIHAPALAQAKTAFLQSAARLEQARREYERARMLLQQEAIDQKETLRRKTEFDNASSELGVAESNLHSFGFDQAAVDGLLARARSASDKGPPDELADPYLYLVSPLAGRVIDRDVVAGQHIEPQKPLFTVSNLHTLWAVLDAREADLPHLAANRVVRLRTSVYPDRLWEGRVVHVGDVVDEKSRTVKVRVETRNDGLLLKPNMYIRGEVAGAAGSRQVLTVPDDAIQTFDGSPVVFVRVADGRFAARPVELGDRLGSRRVVTKGLEGRETIAITGTFNLKAELLKSTLGGE